MNTAFFAWTRNLEIYRFTQLLLILILPCLVTIALGGFRQSSVVIIWAALCPLGSLLLEEPRRTRLWIVGFVALLVVTALLQPHLAPADLPNAFVTWFFVFNVGSVIAIAFGLLYYFVGRRNFFQERSEMLLLNILPKEISEALKTEPRAIAAHYDGASILFADIVEFTPTAATMTPLSLVDLLNDVFECFDTLVDKYDLEKIKTIGDCGRRRRAAPARRSRPSLSQLRARHAGRDRPADVRRAKARLPHRHQLRPGRRGRHRPQKIHLRPLGRDGKRG